MPAMYAGSAQPPPDSEPLNGYLTECIPGAPVLASDEEKIALLLGVDFAALRAASQAMSAGSRAWTAIDEAMTLTPQAVRAAGGEIDEQVAAVYTVAAHLHAVIDYCAGRSVAAVAE